MILRPTLWGVNSVSGEKLHYFERKKNPLLKKKKNSTILKKQISSIKLICICFPLHTTPLCYANNKGADQPVHPCSLISAFVVRCLDSIISLVSISEISSLYLASVAEQAGLSLPWSQTSRTGLLATRLNYGQILIMVTVQHDHRVA